jgi:hypothetical protein
MINISKNDLGITTPINKTQPTNQIRIRRLFRSALGLLLRKTASSAKIVISSVRGRKSFSIIVNKIDLVVPA